MYFAYRVHRDNVAVTAYVPLQHLKDRKIIRAPYLDSTIRNSYLTAPLLVVARRPDNSKFLRGQEAALLFLQSQHFWNYSSRYSELEFKNSKIRRGFSG